MSKSRLEKFLYALYSLDSSDLPTPLSRIEELYKCLVTGSDIPTFEPISRVEKYLMAILGGYDVDSLPNPLSRVEVLLYKLATGDDNLDDVKTFLSEHEELLAEIIRNGGVGGNIDIEYVLYTLSTEHNTLYNTAEKPVKSAILKGNTLVNLYPVQRFDKVVEENKLTDLTGQQSLKIPISNGKKAIFTFNISTPFTSTFKGFYQTLPDWNLVNFSITNGKNFIILDTAINNTDIVSFDFYIVDAVVGNYTITDMMVIEYQDGMENWDIPYFEGMQSVKMPVLTTTGKNLFDGKMELGSITTKGIPEDSVNCLRSVNFIKIKPSTLYTITNDLGYTIALYEYDSDFNFIKNTTYNKAYTTLENAAYIKIKTSVSKVETDLSVKFQIEEGKSGTSYQSHKSNILTVNEEVELRRIGEVQDTLDCLTGEVIERIGEIVLDGTEDWIRFTVKNGINLFHLYTNNYSITNYEFNCVTPLKTVKYGDYYPNVWEDSTVSLFNGYHQQDREGIGIFSNKQSVNEFKSWLSQNPLKMVIILKNPTVKTVDLSVVDQDGNDTKLSTFNDITYVTLSSEGLIPEAELEVATKNEEDLEDSIVYTVHTLSEGYNTLYNTAEKPVKSAILKGSSTVNLSTLNGEITITPGSAQFSDSLLKSTTIYTVSFNCSSAPSTGSIEVRQVVGSNAVKMDNKSVIQGYNQFIILSSGSGAERIRFKNNSASTTDFIFNDLMILEGDYTKGIPSVKMPVLTTSNEDGTKSTTVTCNEEVELRCIGDVKDELDLLTGELTRRINESGNILSQEITESIDISVVDQDGNDTELKTFNDITHVTLSSEGLILEAELEVAEKVPEVAINMLSISREQEVIDTTTNEQSENVDATMIATTEIYEQIL